MIKLLCDVATQYEYSCLWTSSGNSLMNTGVKIPSHKISRYSTVFIVNIVKFACDMAT
jgi:uncharacterized membrane protein